MHFPQPPSPSKGMGAEYASCCFFFFFFCCVLELGFSESGSRFWIGARMRDARSEIAVVMDPPSPLPFLPLMLEINFGTNVNPTARRNATRAVLHTSDSKTVRNLDQKLLEAGVRYVYSTGDRSGLSSDTARLDTDIMGGTLLLALEAIVDTDDAAAADDDDRAKLETLVVLCLRSSLSLQSFFVAWVRLFGFNDEGENAIVCADCLVVIIVATATKYNIDLSAILKALGGDFCLMMPPNHQLSK